MASTEALLIFARYPRLGSVKTRLRPRYTDPQILRLYRAFLLDTLTWASRLEAELHLYLADCSMQEAQALVKLDPAFSGVRVRTQQGRDLGERMAGAYREAAPRSAKVVYVGADTPALPESQAAEAFSRLGEHRVVIGPSNDGGYYLLGLAAPFPELFEGIPWGTSGVLAASLAKIPRRDVHLLAECSDVDTPEDLERLAAELRRNPGRAPRTCAVVSSLVESASCR